MRKCNSLLKNISICYLHVVIHLGLNALEMHFSKTVMTITAIQTETAAVYGEMTSFVHKITP